MSYSTNFQRLCSLIVKESKQLLRDKSNLGVGLLLPIVLILLFGYGLSFDLSKARVAVVVDQDTPQTVQIWNGLSSSKYLQAEYFHDFKSAENALMQHKTDAILHIPANFADEQTQGQAHIQLILNGANTTVANSLQGYVLGAISTVSGIQSDRANSSSSVGSISIEQRMWFNEASNSTWFLVPGLMVLILTLIGAFLTALLIARERERGTLEALFVTPVRPLELVLAKLAPYLIIGVIDLVLCLLASYFIFHVPIRGSLGAIILVSMLYLVVSLALGLTISGYAKGQFQASQLAMLISFMPAMMLSGFVFDLSNQPYIVQFISQLLPATHFMQLLKTLFLSGNDWALIFKECGILLIYALVLINASRLSLRKKLG